jgi:hypothetical protein
MADTLQKHRVIGIRHALKEIRDAGLIPDGITYPEDAVEELLKTLTKANGAKRHRSARSDASIPSLISTIENLFLLPEGSVHLTYPSGRKARSDSSVGALRRHWENYSD